MNSSLSSRLARSSFALGATAVACVLAGCAAPAAGDEAVTASTSESLVAQSAPDGASRSTRIKQIALGDQTSYALAEDGTVWAWGSNNMDALGNGAPPYQTNGSTTPIRVPVGRARRISAGASGACALLEGGTVSCWGMDNDDGIGGAPVWDATPQPIQQLSGAIGIAQGGGHGCAWKEDGSVWCWGNDSNGEGGDPSLQSLYDTARQVQGASDAIDVVASWASTCLLTRAGEVDCFGADDYGQLGNGAPDDSAYTTPVKVPLAGKAHALYGGNEPGTFCAATSSGIECWGWGRFGVAGTGADTVAIPSPTPVAVAIPRHARLAFGAVTCSWDDDGPGACWGYGGDGLLVNGGADSLVPVPITANRHIDQIAVGGFHACLLSEDKVVCWGRNYNGQLGNGTTSNDVSAPAAVQF